MERSSLIQLKVRGISTGIKLTNQELNQESQLRSSCCCPCRSKDGEIQKDDPNPKPQEEAKSWPSEVDDEEGSVAKAVVIPADRPFSPKRVQKPREQPVDRLVLIDEQSYLDQQPTGRDSSLADTREKPDPETLDPSVQTKRPAAGVSAAEEASGPSTSDREDRHSNERGQKERLRAANASKAALDLKSAETIGGGETLERGKQAASRQEGGVEISGNGRVGETIHAEPSTTGNSALAEVMELPGWQNLLSTPAIHTQAWKQRAVERPSIVKRQSLQYDTPER